MKPIFLKKKKTKELESKFLALIVHRSFPLTERTLLPEDFYRVVSKVDQTWFVRTQMTRRWRQRNGE